MKGMDLPSWVVVGSSVRISLLLLSRALECTAPSRLDPGPGTYCSSLGGSNLDSKIGSSSCPLAAPSELGPMVRTRKEAGPGPGKPRRPRKQPASPGAGRWGQLGQPATQLSLDCMNTHNPRGAQSTRGLQEARNHPCFRVVGSAAADKGNTDAEQEISNKSSTASGSCSCMAAAHNTLG